MEQTDTFDIIHDKNVPIGISISRDEKGPTFIPFDDMGAVYVSDHTIYIRCAAIPGVAMSFRSVAKAIDAYDEIVTKYASFKRISITNWDVADKLSAIEMSMRSSKRSM